MPQMRSLIGAGLHTTAAQAIQGASAATTFSAAGSTQGTAAALTSDVTLVTTVGAGQGVILPVGLEFDDYIVVNGQGVNALLVYPPTGAAINGLAANAGYSVAANKGARFIRIAPLVWVVVGP